MLECRPRIVFFKLTSSGLCEAVIMTPIVAPLSFFERKAAKIATLYITEPKTFALQIRYNT